MTKEIQGQRLFQGIKMSHKEHQSHLVQSAHFTMKELESEHVSHWSSVSRPVSSRAGAGTQTSLFSAQCSVHCTTVTREHFRGETGYELGLGREIPRPKLLNMKWAWGRARRLVWVEVRKHWAVNSKPRGLLLTYSEQTGKDSRQSHVRKMVFWKFHLAMN